MKGLIKWLVNNTQHRNFLLQLLQHFAKAEKYFFCKGEPFMLRQSRVLLEQYHRQNHYHWMKLRI